MSLLRMLTSLKKMLHQEPVGITDLAQLTTTNELILALEVELLRLLPPEHQVDYRPASDAIHG